MEPNCGIVNLGSGFLFNMGSEEMVITRHNIRDISELLVTPLGFTPDKRVSINNRRPIFHPESPVMGIRVENAFQICRIGEHGSRCGLGVTGAVQNGLRRRCPAVAEIPSAIYRKGIVRIREGDQVFRGLDIRNIISSCSVTISISRSVPFPDLATDPKRRTATGDSLDSSSRATSLASSMVTIETPDSSYHG